MTRVVPDLAELLDDVEAAVLRYVVMGGHQAVAVTLWVAHTYVLDAAEVTPYLAITSPERRTGKSRLLEVLGGLAWYPVSTANMSPAALFRMIEEHPRAVLFDELDAAFHGSDGNEDLRRLLNAGFTRGGQVQRCEQEGKKQVVRSYSVFSPKALAAIGMLPDTIADRSIPIRMHRKTAAEQVERFRRRMVDFEPIRARLEDWGAAAVDHLTGAFPALPDALDDRAADAWEPLFAIADMAGHGWGGRARIAALALADDKGAEETAPSLLLAHIRDAFDGRDRLPSVEMLNALVDREDGPWAKWWANDVEAGRTKGPASRLAKMLKPFGIKPRKLRVGEATFKGYLAEDFRDAWARYLPPSSGQGNTANKGTGNTNQAPDQGVPLFPLPGEGGP